MSIGAGLAAVVAMIYSSMNKKQYMEGEEHGTARYGHINEEASSLRDEDEKTIFPIQRTSLYQ